MINRYYADQIKSKIEPNKVLIVYGPRRVGKTTLIQNFLKDYKLHNKVFESTGENRIVKDVLESSDFSKIIPFFSDYDLIFIDEAQKIENIGSGLKIIVDQIPGIKVIVTGSSSFDLSNEVGEPLVGRQWVLKLYPISAIELVENYGNSRVLQDLENLLVYGGYPEVVTSESFESKIDFLNNIKDSYMFKDILELENIKNPKKIQDLLRLIAFQIGKEVSLSELGNNLDLHKDTVYRYLDLLEKSFIIINIRGFSRNLRKEVTKTSRYYFYDNGIRNAIVGNFNFLKNRDDIGMLWENFLFIERLKKQEYHKIYSNNYFWRTWDQKEIDMVEEREGKLFGYEFKYSKPKKKDLKDWLETYSNAEFKVITKDNFLEFIT